MQENISKSALVRYGLCLAGVWKVGPNLAPTTSILLCLLQLPTLFPAVAHGPLVPDNVLGPTSYVDPVLAAVALYSTLKHSSSTKSSTLDYGRSHAPVSHVSPEPHAQLPTTVPDPSTATPVSATRPSDDFGAL